MILFLHVFIPTPVFNLATTSFWPLLSRWRWHFNVIVHAVVINPAWHLTGPHSEHTGFHPQARVTLLTLWWCTGAADNHTHSHSTTTIMDGAHIMTEEWCSAVSKQLTNNLTTLLNWLKHNERGTNWIIWLFALSTKCVLFTPLEKQCCFQATQPNSALPSRLPYSGRKVWLSMQWTCTVSTMARLEQELLAKYIIMFP